jgi:succinate dehydrogenase / fumarate reductase membrane anchor subunit
MALFTIVLLVQVLFSGPLGYDSWAGIFAAAVDEGADLRVIVSLGWHAWVGVRDIWMDYIKPAALRLVLQVATIVWLVGCMGWAVQVLWRL